MHVSTPLRVVTASLMMARVDSLVAAGSGDEDRSVDKSSYDDLSA